MRSFSVSIDERHSFLTNTLRWRFIVIDRNQVVLLLNFLFYLRIFWFIAFGVELDGRMFFSCHKNGLDTVSPEQLWIRLLLTEETRRQIFLLRKTSRRKRIRGSVEAGTNCAQKRFSTLLKNFDPGRTRSWIKAKHLIQLLNFFLFETFMNLILTDTTVV